MRFVDLTLPPFTPSYLPRNRWPQSVHFLEKYCVLEKSMASSEQTRNSKPPLLLKLRSSKLFIGITVFAAAFNVRTIPIRESRIADFEMTDYRSN